jgi:hypothetical protein
MKLSKSIIAIMVCIVLVMFQSSHGATCNKKVITLAAIETDGCECAVYWPPGQSTPGGPHCPVGTVINVGAYEKCVAGDIYSKCENETQVVGAKWSCTLEYDYVALAACGAATTACGWACFWSVLPPTPPQILVCAGCLAALVHECAPCDYAACTLGPMQLIHAPKIKGDTESICER